MVNQVYVYKTTNPGTGEFHYGSRTVYYGKVDRDIYYFGSGSWPKEMRKNGVVLIKEVIAVYDDRNEARDRERELIRLNRFDPLCKNVNNFVPKPKLASRGPQRPDSRPAAIVSIKSKLHAYLLARGMTQSEFAQLIGVKVSAVSKWICGKGYAKPSTAKKIIALSGGVLTYEDVWNMPKYGET